MSESSYQCCIFLPFHTAHGVLKARILKWFAIPFSSGPRFISTLYHDPSVLDGPTWHGMAHSFIELDKAVVHVIQQTAAHQAPPSLGFSRQEHWSGLPFPLPGDLPDPGIKHLSPMLQENSLPSEPPGKPSPLEGSQG